MLEKDDKKRKENKINENLTVIANRYRLFLHPKYNKSQEENLKKKIKRRKSKKENQKKKQERRKFGI